MAVSYGSGVSRVEKVPLMTSETDHDIQEYYLGQRYSQIIQRNQEGRIAPYLPFLEFVKEYEQFAVVRAYTIMSRDEQNQFIPANAILAVDDGTDYYEGRPLVYAAADYGSVLSTLNPTSSQQNIHAFDGDLVVSGDLNAEGLVHKATPGGATDGGISSTNWVKTRAARFPVGVVTDKVLTGAGRIQYQEQDPQRTLTMLTSYTLLVAEKAENRYNYGQATRNAILHRNDLVGAGTDAASAYSSANVGTGTGATELAGIPYWANQGVEDGTAATANDLILPGDLVASDDWGRFVRFDGRVDNWNIDAAGGPGSPTDLEMWGRYPVPAVNAIVGRCHGRETVVTSDGLSNVRVYKNTTKVGGSGTGAEKVLTRGDAMTAGEVTSLQATMDPGGLTITNTEWDAVADAKYGLLIHIVI